MAHALDSFLQNTSNELMASCSRVLQAVSSKQLHKPPSQNYYACAPSMAVSETLTDLCSCAWVLPGSGCCTRTVTECGPVRLSIAIHMKYVAGLEENHFGGRR